jgi:MFS family permease
MPRARLLTRPFALCSLANLAQGTAFSLFLHFPGFLNGIGASDVEIGFLFGLTGIAAILARPPIGRAMDTRGRRGVILLGNAINVSAIALYLCVDRVDPALYAIRIAHGIAEAMLFTALFTYAADCVPAARRTEGLALFGISGMLPIALGGLLGDLILRGAGYTALFWASCGFAALSLLLSLPLRDLPRGDAEQEASRGFWAALTQRDLLPIWWVTFAFALAVAAVFTFVKRFVDETGLASVGGFFSAYSGAAILLRLGLGWLPDRIGPKRVLFPALGGVALACCLLAGATDAHQVIIAGTLFGMGHGFAFPVLFGILVTRARDADRGSAMGIFTALFDAGAVAGGPLIGALIMGAGFGAAFAAAAGIVAAGMLSFLVWDGRR